MDITKYISQLCEYKEGDIIDFQLNIFNIENLELFKSTLKLHPEIINKLYVSRFRLQHTFFDLISYPLDNFEDYLDLVFKYNVHYRIIKYEIDHYGGISKSHSRFIGIFFKYYFAAKYKRILISYWLRRRIRQIKHKYIIALLSKSRINMFNVIDEFIDFTKKINY